VKIRRSLLKDTVSVQTLTGESSYDGPTYAAAVEVGCSVEYRRRLVRTATGDEVVSEAQLTVHPDDEATFTPESLVTVDGRDSQVIGIARHTVPRGRTAGLHHLTVDLA
jgi:hypothetical protein